QYSRAVELATRVPHDADRDEPPIDLGGLLHRAAEAAALAGQYTRAVYLGRRALANTRQRGDPGRIAFFEERLRWYLWESGDVDAGVARLRGALGVAELVNSDEGIALGHSNLAALLESCGRTSDALVQAKLGIEAVDRRGLGDTYGGVLRATAASCLFELGR